MDYTKDALEFTTQQWAAVIMDKMGTMIPGNSAFRPDNFKDSLKDSGIFVMRPKAGRAWFDQHTAMRWKENVCDCDTRTMCCCADLARVADSLEWTKGGGVADIWYLSKSLGLPHVNRLSGYHSTPSIVLQNEAGTDVDLWIVQPKVLHPDGSITPSRWNTPQEESRGFVFAVGGA